MNELQFNILKWGYARASELQDFRSRNVWPCEYGIKGHNRSWVIDATEWRSGMKVLDIGAGPSALPAYLADHYGVEMWVADDFGKSSGDEDASQLVTGRDLQKEHPQVRYVCERVGDNIESSALPTAYFDVIYSISVLEHVPPAAMPKVFEHMISLLKPDGLLLHAVDLPFPIGMGKVALEKIKSSHRANEFTGEGWAGRNLRRMLYSKRSFVAGLLSGCAALPLQLLWHQYRKARATSRQPYLLCAPGWKKFVKQNLNVVRGAKKMKSTGLWNMSLDPDVLVEPVEQIYLGQLPRGKPKHYWRIGSLLFVIAAQGQS